LPLSTETLHAGRRDEQECSAVRDGLADDEVQVDESMAQNPVDDRPRKQNHRQRPEGVQGYDQSRVFGCAKCRRHRTRDIEQQPENDNEDDSHLGPARGIGRDKAGTQDQHTDQ
jgi:hypothetical protein